MIVLVAMLTRDALADWMALVKIPGVWECRGYHAGGDYCEAASRFFWITDARGLETRLTRAPGGGGDIRDESAFRIVDGKKCRNDDPLHCFAYRYRDGNVMTETEFNGATAGATSDIRFFDRQPRLCPAAARC